MVGSGGIGPGGTEPPLPPAPGGRRIWVICGAVLAAVLIGVFVWTTPLNPILSVVGIGLVVALFAAMLAVAATVRRTSPRTAALAWLLCAMAIGSVLLVVLQSFVPGPLSS